MAQRLMERVLLCLQRAAVNSTTVFNLDTRPGLRLCLIGRTGSGIADIAGYSP
jgi:hypothetical protein